MGKLDQISFTTLYPGACIIKLIMVVSYYVVEKANVFVTVIHFRPVEIFSVKDNDKHSSLLHYGLNYDSNTFHSPEDYIQNTIFFLNY